MVSGWHLVRPAGLGHDLLLCSEGTANRIWSVGTCPHCWCEEQRTELPPTTGRVKGQGLQEVTMRCCTWRCLSVALHPGAGVQDRGPVPTGTAMPQAWDSTQD